MQKKYSQDLIFFCFLMEIINLKKEMNHLRFAGLEFRFFRFGSVGKGSEFRIKNRKLQIKPCTTTSRNFYMQYVCQSTYFTIETWKFCNHIGLFAVIRSRSKSREIFWSIIDQAWSHWGELISVGAFSIILKRNSVFHHQIFVFCMGML